MDQKHFSSSQHDDRRFAALRVQHNNSHQMLTQGTSLPFISLSEPPIIDPTALANVPPIMKPDGLLLTTVRKLPLNIEVPIPDGVIPELPEGYHDALQLLLNGQPYGEQIDITPENANAPILFQIAAADRQEERTYRIGYRYWTGLGQEWTNFSSSVSFITDYTPPGLPKPGALFIDPDIVTNGLSEAVLEELGNRLPALIPSYLGEAEGDYAQLYVNDIPADSPIQLPPGGIGKEFPVDFEHTQIGQVKEGLARFWYTLTDRAGNTSPPSEVVLINVIPKGSIEDLQAPRIPVYDTNGIITDADARAGVVVEIPGHDKIQRNDKILLFWGKDKNAVTVESAAISSNDVGHDPVLRIKLPYAALQKALNTGTLATRGTIDAWYQVLRGGLNLGTSSAQVDVLVDLTLAGGVDPDPSNPVHGLLIPLTVYSEAKDKNMIPPFLSDKDATAAIPWLNVNDEPVFQIGDQVQIFWNGQPALDMLYDVTQEDIDDRKEEAHPLCLTVPGHVILNGGSNSKFPVYYTITRALEQPPENQLNISRSPDQSVDVKSEADLPGGEKGLRAGLFDDRRPEKAINNDKANNTPWFRVPPYLNKSANDLIELTVTAYLYPSDVQVGEPFVITHTVVEGKEKENYEFTMPKSLFTAPEFATALGQAKATYKVISAMTGKSGVLSHEAKIFIDTRARLDR